MRIDISFLPALAAAFMLVFARIGAMVMLLPGLGETNMPVRVRLTIALVLTLIMLPLHRAAYTIDLTLARRRCCVLLVQEIVIGAVLGADRAADDLGAAGRGLGDRPAARPRLRHRGRSDPGPAGRAVGNFLTILGVTLMFATDLHHLVIAALNDSYRLFSPGEMLPIGDVAALVTRAFAAAFRIGMQLSAPFLVFGLVFNIGLGVLSRLMPQMQVYLRRRAAVDPGRLPDPRCSSSAR